MRRLLVRWWPWALAVGSMLVAALVVGPARPGGEVLDPRSTSPQGARGLVDVLAELGRPVSIATRPGPDAAAFLVLSDRLDAAARDDAEAWLAAGGRLVVADPGSPLLDGMVVTGRLPTDVVGPTSLPPDCGDPELVDVGLVRSAAWLTFAVEPGDRSCFRLESGAWLVRRTVGDGELVALGGADAFTNSRLGEADNALLLVRLLGEDGPVVVADASPPGGGEATLGELVPDRVYVSLALLALAFVVAAWARGRRLGRPVEERLPVRIPASELVLATADLMRRSDVRDAAAAALRGGFRREAGTRLGLPEDAPADVVGRRVAAWTGHDPDGVVRALEDAPVPDDDALVRVARSVARLREALTGGQLASRDGDDARHAAGTDEGNEL